jgi:hypothetical protein
LENVFGNGNIDLDILLDAEEIFEQSNEKLFLTEKEKREQKLLSMGIIPANRPKKNKRKKKRK